ncbi:hypothetical protein KNE206_51420 [Kitasatospora sp. NE20-6]
MSVPNSIAPSERTLTSRRVAGSLPMVRYFTVLCLRSPTRAVRAEGDSSSWSPLQVKPVRPAGPHGGPEPCGRNPGPGLGGPGLGGPGLGGPRRTGAEGPDRSLRPGPAQR